MILRTSNIDRASSKRVALNRSEANGTVHGKSLVADLHGTRTECRTVVLAGLQSVANILKGIIVANFHLNGLQSIGTSLPISMSMGCIASLRISVSKGCKALPTPIK